MSSKIPDPEIGMTDAAKFLGLSPQRMRELCKADEIEHERDPVTDRFRFKFSSLMKFAQQREKEKTRKAKERRAAMDARQRAERQS